MRREPVAFALGVNPVKFVPVLSPLRFPVSCPPMTPDEVTEAVTTSIWSHLLTVGGFLLAVFAIARVMSDRKQAGNGHGGDESTRVHLSPSISHECLTCSRRV